ncbi:MAG: ABC transporter permease, partial [Bryobacteraceae bacterium]
MISDLRFALRMIGLHRWFSLAVVATLALGIGLNTMVFTLVNAVLFKPVAVAGGERLFVIRNRNLSKGGRSVGVSYPEFREYRAQATSLEHVEAESRQDGILSEQGNPPQKYNLDLVSSGIFEMMHVRPVLGRGFLPADDKAGAESVLLLSHGVWMDRYGSSPDAVGRAVRVNAKPATIIGVMPEGFKFPDNVELWMPLVPTAEMESRTLRPLQLFAMRKPGVTLPEAGTELQGIAGRIAAQHPDSNKGIDLLVQTFHERYNGGNVKSVFVLLLAAVGFVLLIACANVANMMLSRALARQREVTIRAAMGASRWRLIRQLLVESLLLSVAGGLVGLTIAMAGVHGFDLVTRDVGKPYWVTFTMDYNVFGYFAALCGFSGLLFGLAPAIRSSRVDLNSVMKDGVRTAGTQRGGSLAGVLVVLQFALTLVLLSGAGLFVRSFLDSQSVNNAVPADHILTARVSLPRERYATADARARFFEQLRPRLEALPGVSHVAIGSSAPGLGAGGRKIEIEDTPLTDPARGPSASVLVQFPGYFNAVNIPVLLGRDFDDADGGAGRQVTVVTKEFAARYWPNQPALGKRLRFYANEKPGEWMTVIGISARSGRPAGGAV